jgi:hypothetical protein
MYWDILNTMGYYETYCHTITACMQLSWQLLHGVLRLEQMIVVSTDIIISIYR